MDIFASTEIPSVSVRSCPTTDVRGRSVSSLISNVSVLSWTKTFQCARNEWIMLRVIQLSLQNG